VEQQAYAGGVKDTNGDVLFGILLRDYQRSSQLFVPMAWNCHNVGGARWFSIRAVKQSPILNEVGGPPRTPKQRPPPSTQQSPPVQFSRAERSKRCAIDRRPAEPTQENRGRKTRRAHPRPHTKGREIMRGGRRQRLITTQLRSRMLFEVIVSPC